VTIVLLGLDPALLEGLAQLLAVDGLRPVIAHDALDPIDLARMELPIAAVIDRSLAMSDPATLRIPLAAHGAFVLFRTDEAPVDALPPAVARHVLADLTLPLERQRLLALVRTLAQRERESGRTLPESQQDRAH
jgi:DNA-binding NtrC family response regulator